MSGFFKSNCFLMPTYNNDDRFFIQTVGYHDFTVVAPSKVFRIQNFYTLHYVISGSGTLKIGNQEFFPKAGDCFFIPPDVTMMYYPSEDDPWEYVWFHFNGKIAASYGKELGFSESCPVLKMKESAKILNTLLSLLKNLDRGIGNSYYAALSAFYEFMYFLSEPDSSPGARGAKKIIDRNFSDPSFNIADLCAALHISHSHLCRLFKEEYGVSIIRYIIEQRLDFSCNLLKSTNLPIKAIASSCGYSDEIHFSKTFKKRFSVSPGEFRKLKRSSN